MQGAPDDGAFQEFANAGPQMGEALPQDAFHFEQIRREQESMQRRNWAGEFVQQGPGPQFVPEELAQRNSGAGFSAQDFANFTTKQAQSPLGNVTPTFSQQSAFQRPMYGSGFGMQRPMMFQSQYMNQAQQPLYQGKGKGRIEELSDTDWEQQFQQLTTDDQDAELLDREAEEAMERELNQADRYVRSLCPSTVRLVEHMRDIISSYSNTFFNQFEHIMDGFKHETNVSREMFTDEDLMANHFGDEYDQWKDFEGQFTNDLRTHDYSPRPELGNYLFEENNIFDNRPNAFEEGQKIVREGGNLSLAALAFEAAVQKQHDHVEAWVALGHAQAENEKESPAIRALEQALKLDPSNLDALMGLAVSYTNEGYDSLAYRTLERWVGVKYPQLGVIPRGLGEEEEEIGFTDRHILHEKVTSLFLEAAQMNPDGENVDVDVQVGLGVLFYGSEDYDKAVDCFNAALQSAQHGAMKREGEEHLLWNRLGATLANSGRSEEAIEAYSRALELRGNFVRARYNLGVSCINLGVQEEAAVHLLSALDMHRVLEAEGREKAAEMMKDGSGRDVDAREVEAALQQNQSTNLYDTLRRVFTQMGRRDLSERVGPDMNLDSFRGEFDF